MSSSCQAPSPASRARAQAVERVAREAVGVHAAPSVVDRILEEAVRGAGLAEAPSDGEALGRFLGTLLGLCEERFGHEAASMVRMEIEMILGPVAAQAPPPSRTSSGVRGQRPDRSDRVEEPLPEIELELDFDAVPASAADEADPPSDVYPSDSVSPYLGSTRPRPALDEEGDPAGDSGVFPSEAPGRRERGERYSAPNTVVPEASLHVVLATTAKGLAGAVRSGMPPGVAVRQVEGLFELLDAASEVSGRLCIVLDSASPSLGASSAATLWPDFPEGTTLLLWGGEPRDLEELEVLLGEAVHERVRIVPAGVDHLVTNLLRL